jgi:predicted nucleotidyltransferase
LEIRAVSFAVLDNATRRRLGEREAARRQALADIDRGLSRLCPRYGAAEAYVFGSVLREGRFGSDSDVDVAVSGIGAELWRFAAELSRAVGREVDVIDLTTSRFATRIRREGRRWTPTC